MRFEIRAGGALLFLAGLAALSGTVFALGLIAGYEMARQNQVDSSQLATSYPLPSPAVAAAAPTTAVSPVDASGPPQANPPAPVARASAPVIALPSGHARTASASRAAAQPPPAEEAADDASIPSGPGLEERAPAELDNGTAANPPSVTGGTAPPPAKVAATEPPLTSRRHPFNIQIDAVMDSAGAQQMAGRLRKLGYTPTIVHSNIAGQSWYRIKVGPYTTEAEARAAQGRLRAQYNAAYAGH